MIGEIRGYGWTHDSGPLDAGPKNSSYKTLVTMKDKLDSQLSLGKVLRSAVAERVVGAGNRIALPTRHEGKSDGIHQTENKM